MRAVVLRGETRTLELVDIPEPALEEPGHVLVRVLQVGVCGTDRAIARGEEGELPPGARHLVLGHEMVGRVETGGAGVSGLKPGDLVVATVRRGCGECESCFHGESDNCYTGRFRERGIIREHGYMTSLILESQENLVSLPPSLERIGFLAEPLSTCEKAMETVRRFQARLRPRCGHPEHGWDQEQWGECKRALVVGAGAIGILTAFLLRLHNVETAVMATQPTDSPKGSLARAIGGDYLSTADISVEDLSSHLVDLDLIVDATGAPDVALQVAPQLKACNSVLVLLGVPGGSGDATVDAGALVREMVLNNRVFLGSVNANRRHFEMAARHLAQFQERFGDAINQVVARTYPLEEFREAFFHAPRSAIKVSLTL